MEEDKKELSLNQKIDIAINKLEQMENIEEKKNKKSIFRLPYMKTLLGWKKKSRDYIIVMKINTNRTITFTKAPIIDGTMNIDGIDRMALTDHILYYKRKPIIIVPAWSIKPFSASDNLSEAEREKTMITGRRAVASKMRTDAIQPKKFGNFGWLGWVLVLAAVGGLIYYLVKGGKLF